MQIFALLEITQTSPHALQFYAQGRTWILCVYLVANNETIIIYLFFIPVSVCYCVIVLFPLNVLYSHHVPKILLISDIIFFSCFSLSHGIQFIYFFALSISIIIQSELQDILNLRI